LRTVAAMWRQLLQIGDCIIEISNTRLLRVVTLASAQGRYGGPYDTAVRQADVAADLGVQTTVFAGVLRDDAPDFASIPPNVSTAFVRVHRLLPSPGFTSLLSMAAVTELWRQVGRADIVHVSAARECLPVLAMAFTTLRRRRLVSQPHGMLTGRSSSLHRALDLMLKPLVRRSERVIALTDVERSDLERWMGKGKVPAITVLGNPLPPGLRPVTTPPTSKNALFVARLHPRKRVGDFVKAAEIALERGWGEQYRVVGPDQGDLGQVQQSSSYGKNLHYEGPVPASQVPGVVAQCGVFVLPSENEPWGNVLATALALGRPTVVTRSTALARLIERYGAGIVVNDAAPREIAEAVHAACTPSRSVDISHGARRLAQDLLSPGAQREGLSTLYRLR
jgi:glycosyltransferase involved in cell wall biosynthesis